MYYFSTTPSYPGPRVIDNNTNIDNMPTADWLHHTYGAHLPSDNALAELRLRFPVLTGMQSFAAIVDHSAKYLKKNAVLLASTHAEEYFRTNPRLDIAKVACDTAEAHSMGLLAFLTARSEALRPVTIQTTGPLPPDPRPDIISRPYRPLDETMANYHDLPNGAKIITPPDFRPDGCPNQKPKPPGYALAVEFHQNKDHRLGLSIVLPLADAHALFAAAGIPLNGTPTAIVAATDKPEGRLTVDSTRSGINHPSKKTQLVARHGPISNPTHADWCRLFAIIRRIFVGRGLVIFKADFDRWFKRIRLHPWFVGLLAMVFHIDNDPYVVIPLVGQFGCQEFNYMSSQVAAVIHSRLRDHDIALHGFTLRLCYADDTVGQIPLDLYEADDAHFTAVAVAHAGTNAAPATKKDKAEIITVIGARYDISDPANERIGIPEALFIKLVCVFFQECPRVLIPGVTRLRFKFYQRMGSYMCLAANYITWLRPHTHAVYDNICHFTNNPYHVTVNERTTVDISYWRWALISTQISTTWLDVPMFIPPLVSRPKDQEQSDFAVYQAAHAHYIVGTDAATFSKATPFWGAGWTSTRPGENINSWGMYMPATYEAFLHLAGCPMAAKPLAKLDQINFYEAIAMVWSSMQRQYRATVLSGHIRGLDNKTPDAISRNFDVVDGSSIREKLSHMVPHLNLPHWFHSLQTCSTLPSDKVWQAVAELLMELEPTL